MIDDHITMKAKEKFTLTWHSYSDHLREALGEMMTSSEFADVTIVDRLLRILYTCHTYTGFD